jgi:hypothetical protein
MKAAKIITLIAFILNGLLTIYLSFTLFQLISLYQEFFEIKQTIFPFLSLFILIIFTIGSLIYYLYLRSKERRGAQVRFALLFSILFL